jgi:K319-like protein
VRIINVVRVLSLFGAVALILPALAETPAPVLGKLSEESIVPFAALSSADSMSIDEGLMSALEAGALELRQLVVYNPADASLQVTGFVVAPGSPLPTPVSTAGLSIVWTYTAAVSQVQLPMKPKYAVAFVAIIRQAPVSPFGAIVGAPFFFSMSYVPSEAGAVTDFRAVAINIAGSTAWFAAKGSGSAEISQPSPAKIAPVAVAGPKGVQTATAVFQLDGTQSYDPTGGALTYKWAFVPVSGQTVTITDEMSAKPAVTLGQDAFSYGDYTFVLTVYNSAGLSSTDTVTVSFPTPDPQ